MATPTTTAVSSSQRNGHESFLLVRVCGGVDYRTQSCKKRLHVGHETRSSAVHLLLISWNVETSPTLTNSIALFADGEFAFSLLNFCRSETDRTKSTKIVQWKRGGK
jgi:hypothetical protein